MTTSVGCVTLAGKLLAVTAPDTNDASAPTAPSFGANVGVEGTAVLVTPDNSIFLKADAQGLSVAKHGDVWTLTVSGTQLGAADGAGKAVTVTGHLTCTKTTGTGAS